MICFLKFVKGNIVSEASLYVKETISANLSFESQQVAQFIADEG